MLVVCSDEAPKLRLLTTLSTCPLIADILEGTDTLTPVTDPDGVIEKLILIVPPAVGLLRRRFS